MNKTAPHYLLFTEAKNDSKVPGHGRWRFVLEQIGTTLRLEEADDEPGILGERLQLLAVVRGLEALEQPSRITLITSSKYVGRGIRRGLTQWRQNDWQWERFGGMTLIKNHDLWQRIDGAMKIHQINCRVWQFDPPHLRTQLANASDDVELSQNGSPLVCPIADPPENGESIPPRQKRINHFKLDLRRSRQARQTMESTLQHVSRVTEVLENKVKPIGQGRAYGYAVN